MLKTMNKKPNKLWSNLQVDTVRDREKTGFVDTPSRNEWGIRKYAGESVEKLRVIRKAQSFGFSLREINRTLMRKSLRQSTRREQRLGD